MEQWSRRAGLLVRAPKLTTPAPNSWAHEMEQSVMVSYMVSCQTRHQRFMTRRDVACGATNAQRIAELCSECEAATFETSKDISAFPDGFSAPGAHRRNGRPVSWDDRHDRTIDVALAR